MYGRHLHEIAHLQAERRQYFATFFLRNRPELELIRKLAGQRPHSSGLNVAVLACSKGAEVYSIAWAIRSAHPDLKLRIHAVDISDEIVRFAQMGIYSLGSAGNSSDDRKAGQAAQTGDVNRNTARDQNAWIFERMSREEIDAMFDIEGDKARVKPWLRAGITWTSGDATAPGMVEAIGSQDIVVANNFLCHMKPAVSENCLRNIARIVKPGGYLCVSGIDLDVRTKIARELGWRPVTDLLKEIHEGDTSLRRGWPFEYWGLEPFQDRPDWAIRYCSVFQIGEPPSLGLRLDSEEGFVVKEVRETQ
jgi:chemotaxis methyl-accepting protein methylase